MTKFTRNTFNLETKLSVGIEYSTRKSSINDHIIQIMVWDVPGMLSINCI